MNKSWIVLFHIFISIICINCVKTACEPVVGIASGNIIFLDTSGENVFNQRFNFSEFDLKSLNNEFIAVRQTENNAVNIFFKKSGLNHNQEISDNYIFRFSNEFIDTLGISYKTEEFGPEDCLGWTTEYAFVTYQDSSYSLLDTAAIITIPF